MTSQSTWVAGWLGVGLVMGCAPQVDFDDFTSITMPLPAHETDYEVTVYNPHGSDADGLPWLLLLDGHEAAVVTDAQAILRKMERSEVGPMVLAGVGDWDTRNFDDAFFDFVRTEVIPWVETESGAGGEPSLRGIFGHSYGGYATQRLLLQGQGSFQRFGASSPSLWVEDGELYGMEEEYAATHSDLEAQVYIGIGTAETMAGLTDLYVSRLEERNYSSLQLTYERLYDQDHWTAYPHALDAMLLSLYREQNP